jgi:uncharacterized protein YgbK (DUF1537 family)
MNFLGGPVRIVADDLTGALDAAAPFARPGQPVGLVLHATEIPDRPALTISTESRDSLPADAAAATTRACDVLRGTAVGALWFHKVDSVLRGHPFAATAAMMRHLDLPLCVFAPAFPAMGRITRGGLHLMRIGDDWHPAAQSDIAAGLQAAGLNPASETAGQTATANALVVDADTQADLDQMMARRTEPHLLWVGSRALAEALAGTVVPVPCPPFGIVVIGTAHPATRAQVAFSVARLSQVAERGPIRPDPGQCMIIDPIASSANAAMTRDAVHQAMLRLDPAGLEGRSLFVTGGETLSVVLKAVAARSLDCLGEVGPGLPISIVRGGRLDGCSIVSKSGGFGAPDLLKRYC